MPTTLARTSPDPARAIPALFREFGPRTYALAFRVTGSASEAEDVVQETFMQAFRRWETFEGRADPGTWLYAIAARAAKRRFRRRKDGTTKRSAMKSFSELSPMRDSGTIDLAIDRTQPADPLMRAEAREIVQAGILRLPPQYRVPLVMKDILEMPLEECAEALGLKLETVKTRIHRARLALRKFLNDGLPTRKAPAPDYDRQLCFDLLQAKLAAMDEGRGFPIGRDVMCERCRLVFAELDLGQNACAELEDRMPAETRKRVERAIRDAR
ncbi:MAG: sigma-70 family RNA polymerase sigma factor [Limnohabitans sp.]|jgi:RNA polymerase sigma-70 factor (ECF subfamily)|nr:sigma-70 family RNA polymerase sigma factor [Limnohabitans sp.]